MFVGNDKGQVINEAYGHDHHHCYPHDDDYDCQVLKIVNFAGEQPSDGSSLPAPVLVEELQVIMVVVMVMLMMMMMMMMTMLNAHPRELVDHPSSSQLLLLDP